MNRSKIEWTDYTWNPVTGCLNDCSYCYARRFAERGLGEYGKHPKGERFKPRFHPERLDEPAKLKKPSKIFVCSMGELFGDWIKNDWINEILDAISQAPQHTYQILTKNPERMSGWRFGENVWAGSTITNQSDLECRIDYQPLEVGLNFVSFEPLLGPIDLSAVAGGIDWAIIGRMTGPGSDKYIPDIEWVANIKNWCDEHGVPVFIKDNLGWWSRYQKFPEDKS